MDTARSISAVLLRYWAGRLAQPAESCERFCAQYFGPGSQDSCVMITTEPEERVRGLPASGARPAAFWCSGRSRRQERGMQNDGVSL